MNRDERRHGVGFTGPRPLDDFVMTRLDDVSEFVLVGMRGDGYVRLDRAQARARAFTLLELAGVESDLLGVARALIEPSAPAEDDG